MSNGANLLLPGIIATGRWVEMNQNMLLYAKSGQSESQAKGRDAPLRKIWVWRCPVETELLESTHLSIASTLSNEQRFELCIAAFKISIQIDGSIAGTMSKNDQLLQLHVS